MTEIIQQALSIFIGFIIFSFVIISNVIKLKRTHNKGSVRPSAG